MVQTDVNGNHCNILREKMLENTIKGDAYPYQIKLLYIPLL